MARRNTTRQPDLKKVYALASRCNVCEGPILPGQTWKFTPEGGKVHYHCAQNPVSLDPRYFLRYGTVMVPPKRASAHRTRTAAPVQTPIIQRYHGSRIWEDSEGWHTSLDRESAFDSLKDAKRFIDAQTKNPNGAPNLAFVAGQLAEQAARWAYPGMKYEEVFPARADEYLMGHAGVKSSEYPMVRAKAKTLFAKLRVGKHRRSHAA
ncbi:MAG: hypothetical protein MUP80_02085 [Acidobacteriia bacterium]|nr:hypothetical protein [Terriglobia bacterium]